MYQALYRKYRPKRFNEVVGQDVIIQTLKNGISSQRINHAYIFAGPRGSGKTSIAKIFAKTVNCQNINDSEACGKCVYCTQTNTQNMDIMEIDAASNNGVDEIREINNKVNLVPSLGKYKVYIIDEVHMLTIGAFNALLKTLEEPPSHVIFILATTDPQKVPITILSRCQRFDFKKISEEKIVERINYVIEKENIEIEKDAVFEIARLGDGSLRDALGILDQVIIYSNDKITINDVHDVNGTVIQKELQNIIFDLVNSNILGILNEIDKYSKKGKNISKVTEELIFLMRNLILFKLNYDLNNNDDLKNLAESVTSEQLLNYISVLNESLNAMKKSINSKMVLEMAFIKIYSLENNEKEINKSGIVQKEEISKENEKQNSNSESENKENINIEKSESKKENIKKISQEIIVKNEDDDYEKEMIDFQKTRIGNVLSKFSKIKTIELKKQIESLNDYLLDEKIGNYVEMILDGQLKAASEEGIIFIFKTKGLSETFNENILEIENILKELFNNNCFIISTDIDNWESIKHNFNSKKVKYEYKQEKKELKEILKMKKNNNNSFDNLFGELLEYK